MNFFCFHHVHAWVWYPYVVVSLALRVPSNSVSSLDNTRFCMASKCKFLYILTVRLRARKPTIKIVGFLARKFYKLFLFISNDLPIIINCHTKLPVTRSITTFSTPFYPRVTKVCSFGLFSWASQSKIDWFTKLPVTRSIATFSTPFLSKKIKTIASDVFIFCVFREFLVDIYGSR